MSGTEFSVEFQAQVPEALSGLTVLANDLTYSWNRQIRSLFHRMDPLLWESCGHSPKVFLRRIQQEHLENAAQDSGFMEDYTLALGWHEEYCQKVGKSTSDTLLDSNKDLVAYFSAEFGFHESLPIYSGGLGILAGDHCKAASDLGLPFVAIGLLYHEGYFTQTIDGHGQQIADYRTHHFNDLPIEPVLHEDGSHLSIQVEIADRAVDVCIWRAKAGNIDLYLLDSDMKSNKKQDRSITYRLYGGDKNTRIQQEILLGIGGVRALRALGLKPNTWHINEGHSAFQIIERMCEYDQQSLDHATALELISSSTNFTTHTPVPAGHDIFEPDTIRHYMAQYIQKLDISFDEFMQLGNSDTPNNFNMTALALRGSSLQNGVSRIHGEVAAKMQSYAWPEIAAHENPISYVTNGVHVPTFLAREWANLFDLLFRNWRNELSNPSFWGVLDEIKDNRYWSIHHTLRSEMLKYVCKRVTRRLQRNGCSETLIRKSTHYLSQPDLDVLVLGFARRFATYKRATLLFQDERRLQKLLNDPLRPVLLIFAGKAHPQDIPGQELIKIIHDYSLRPEFIGKIILLENYDMSLARKLVTGVDVWINTPEYPMEACGTSGQKAGINGVLNLSVLDGWWGEGYNSKNGWAVMPHEPHYDKEYRDYQEASDLINILEKQVIPTYYERESLGYSEKWVSMCKESMKSTIPQFNSERMVTDYVKRFYTPAIKRHERLQQNSNAAATELAQWKNKIRENWNSISIKLINKIPKEQQYQHPIELAVDVTLNELSPDDVRVELLIGEKLGVYEEFTVGEKHLFEALSPKDANGSARFSLSLPVQNCGLYYFKIRAYPSHELLAHPFEMGVMQWL